MEKLTDYLEPDVCYDPWEYCGLDSVCKRSCKGCKIPKMIYKLMLYEMTDLTPEEVESLKKKAWVL